MINIAIDGTSASGKSSVSKEVAKMLNILYLNTGALYRACGIYCIENNLNPILENDIDKIVNNANIEIKYENNNQLTLLNNKDIRNDLISTKVSDITSTLSQNPKIRNKIKLLQKNIAENNDVLIEGRDIGTEILPNAKHKFFITATLEERAKRRFNQLKENNKNITFEDVFNSIKERDYKDQKRTISPLKKADDAILIDTTYLSFNEVVNKIINIIKE